MRHFRSVAIVVLTVLAVTPRIVGAQPKQHPRDVSKLYGELCASCHGPKLTGGLAPSLLDDVWKFGGDDASITLFRPEPQTLFTVVQGTLCGSPAPSAACRAGA